MTAFVLDRPAILARLAGDEELYAVMVDMFIQDLDANCDALHGALQGGDGSTIVREVHSAKGLLATFSDDDGAAFALTVESRARAGELATLGPDIARICARLREVAAVLQGR